MNYDVTGKGYARQNFCLAQSESPPSCSLRRKALVDKVITTVEHSTIDVYLVMSIKLDAATPAVFRASKVSPWKTTSVSVLR
jgi:hypothetical protein